MSKKSPAERIAEYKEKAVAAKMAGDLQTAADWYYKAARLADFDSASEYVCITFPHIYDPISNEKKAAAIGAKIHKWEMGKYLKLRQELTYYGDKERAFQKELEAHDKLAAKYDHPMVDELYGSLYETYCGIQGKAEAYYKKAAERGDYNAAFSLVLAYCHNSFNGSRGTVTGVQDMEQGCVVTITVSQAAEGTRFSIHDNGKGIERHTLAEIRKKLQDGASESIGLANVNERLRLYYNHTAGLTIESNPGEGTVVSFVVPHNQNPSPLLNYEQHAEQLRKEDKSHGE